jgi:Tol biopolymer transport system component
VVSAATAAAISGQAGRSAAYYVGDEGSLEGIWRLDLESLQTSQLYVGEEADLEIGHLGLSPDGELMAFEADLRDPRAPDYLAQSAIMLIRSDGSRVLTVTEAQGPQEAVVNPQWSPDSSILAYAHMHSKPGLPDTLGDVELHVFDPKDGSDRVATAQGGLYFTWSTDGTQIAVGEASVRDALSVLKLSTHQQRVLWEDPGLAFWHQAWRPGGDQIAVAVVAVAGHNTEAQQGLYLVSATTGQRRRLAPWQVAGVYWSPDGKLLLCAGVEAAAGPWLFDVARGTGSRLLDQDIDFPGNSPWSPRGNALLLALEERPKRSYSIVLMTLQNRQVFQLASIDSLAPYPAW